MTEFYTRKVQAHIRQPDGSLGASTWVLAADCLTSHEMIAKLPQRPLKTTATAPRDMSRHRYFFKLIATVHQNLPDGVHKSFEDLREELLIMAGHHRTVVTLEGEVKLKAKSIAGSALDDTAFIHLIDRVIHVICQKVIPGFTYDGESAVLEMIR